MAGQVSSDCAAMGPASTRYGPGRDAAGPVEAGRDDERGDQTASRSRAPVSLLG